MAWQRTRASAEAPAATRATTHRHRLPISKKTFACSSLLLCPRRRLVDREIGNLFLNNGRACLPFAECSRRSLSYPKIHHEFFQPASALRKAVTLGGRNLRLGYTAETGISTDVQRGRRRTRSPRAKA